MPLPEQKHVGSSPASQQATSRLQQNHFLFDRGFFQEPKQDPLITKLRKSEAWGPFVEDTEKFANSCVFHVFRGNQDISSALTSLLRDRDGSIKIFLLAKLRPVLLSIITDAIQGIEVNLTEKDTNIFSWFYEEDKRNLPLITLIVGEKAVNDFKAKQSGPTHSH